MVRDLDMRVEIVPCPTVREPDGLAMSSRNVRLSPEERAQAPVLYRALTAARVAVENGERDAERLKAGICADAGRRRPGEDRLRGDRRLRDLTPVAIVDRPCLIALAVFFGRRAADRQHHRAGLIGAVGRRSLPVFSASNRRATPKDLNAIEGGKEMALFGKDGMVLTCKVTECSYNDAEACRAKRIEVGSPHAMCDTFTTGTPPEQESDMADVAEQSYLFMGARSPHHQGHREQRGFRWGPPLEGRERGRACRLAQVGLPAQRRRDPGGSRAWNTQRRERARQGCLTALRREKPGAGASS